ncbi:hypothetical protein JKF63_02121 [Porcisia hertigi]|uniref:YEATS domain-containing protein n=1 Tax=Porcisia hertigi TaxID=2761500 RepID=A0A836LCE2_9TRYP|nr:hypothetical protein JKF63_02121 [Porcisia hertigi]
MSTESQRVVYGATFDIPYAIGSVSVPLHSHGGPSSSPRAEAQTVSRTGTSTTPPSRRGVGSGNISSVRRCTHHRYCYIRDGGALSQDAFYRWLALQRQEHLNGTNAGTTSGLTNEVSEHTSSAATGCASSNASSSAFPPTPSSPSLFYASVKCVVFVLPNSFPHPRRVVRHPPFMIQDDTWAEHLVEAQIYFWPHLKIPPVTVVHQALLERRLVPATPSPSSSALSSDAPTEEIREVWVPQLLASTYGKPKLPSVATSVKVCVPAHHGPPPASENGKAASLAVVVAEKVDTLHLYHPSLDVVRHIRAVLAMSQLPVLEAVRDAFEATYLASPSTNSNSSRHNARSPTHTAAEGKTRPEMDAPLTTPFGYSWSLPFEEMIAEYAEQRASTSVAVLQTVLEKLKREREEVERACERSMEQISELATATLPTQLQRVHSRCIKLYKKE